MCSNQKQETISQLTNPEGFTVYSYSMGSFVANVLPHILKDNYGYVASCEDEKTLGIIIFTDRPALSIVQIKKTENGGITYSLKYRVTKEMQKLLDQENGLLTIKLEAATEGEKVQVEKKLEELNVAVEVEYKKMLLARDFVEYPQYKHTCTPVQ